VKTLSSLPALFSLTILVAASQGAVPSGNRPDAIDGYELVQIAGGISEYRMPANGLNVLLLEDHSAPVLTFMVTYRVGSRNEVTGTTGATHLLEHLMFKGSKNFHAGNGRSFDTMMDRIGAINNATTWLDRTNYYANLPSDHLELAVQLEADRMRNLLLREEDRQPEMTVVRNEFERGENDPMHSLDKEVTAAAIIAHPYHHSTIGWRSDIENVPIEKLREFYDTFYWPNNATLTVIGDFRPEAALRLIRQYFGAIPRSPHSIPQVYTEEPPQTGPRRVVVKRPGEVGVVQLAYKVPHARHADHAPLEVLAAILSIGKTSRLYRALIDTNLAISADAGKGFFHDDTLFTVRSMLAPGTTHEQAEKALLSEIEKVKQAGVTPAEVERAIATLLASIAYGRDGSFAIAGQINETIAVGDWTLYLTLLEKLESVTADDVQRVAQAYCLEDQSTTGWFIPQSESAQAGQSRGGSHGATAAASREDGGVETGYGPSPGTESGLFARSDFNRAPPGSMRAPYFYRDPAQPVSARQVGRLSASAGPVSGQLAPATGGALVAPKVRRRTVAGVDVLTLKTAIQDVVTIRGVLGAGDVFNPPDHSAIADLTAGMLDKGTVQHDKFALAEMLEQVGATLSFGTGSHTLNFTAKCLRKDVSLVLGLLAEQLRSPRFDAGELDKLKQQLIGRHKRRMEDTNYRAENAFLRAIFPAGHPNRPPADEQYLADIASATLGQLKAFHAANYGPTAARLVAVGDVDDAAIDTALRKAFAGWEGGRPIPPAPEAAAPVTGHSERIMMPGKTSVSYVVGQPSGLRYANPDYQALNVATAALGSGFFSARLLDIVRNREGLTYGIGAALTADTYADGAWYIRGTFAPDLLEQGAASTQRELRRFHDEGLTADELATFKVTLTGSYKVALATTGGLASSLLNALQRGYGPEWVDEYPRRIEAMTLQQVNAAIKKYLNPDSMVVVMAGTLPAESAAAK
jgi:zinc protease